MKEVVDTCTEEIFNDWVDGKIIEISQQINFFILEQELWLLIKIEIMLSIKKING